MTYCAINHTVQSIYIYMDYNMVSCTMKYENRVESVTKIYKYLITRQGSETYMYMTIIRLESFQIVAVGSTALSAWNRPWWIISALDVSNYCVVRSIPPLDSPLLQWRDASGVKIENFMYTIPELKARDDFKFEGY